MDLGSRVIAALRWNAVAKLSSQLLNWAITILVIRLLVPQDYGLMAMTTVFIGLVSGVADIGLGAAVVQARTLTGDQLRRVQGAIFVACLSAFAVLQLGASPVASFFAEPRLTALIRLLAFEVVLAAPGVLAGALLLRDLRLRATATVELVAALVSSCTMLLLAWKGFGVWALAATTVVRAAVMSVGLVALSPVRPLPLFGISEVRGLMGFGGTTTLNGLLNRFGSQLDVLIAGKTLAPDIVGAYAVATHIASLPASKLNAVIGDTVFPVFARLQDDRAGAGRKLMQALGILAFVALPLFFGLSAVAPDAVPFVLGRNWSEAVTPMLLLPLVLPLRMMNGMLVNAAASMGEPAAATRYHVTFVVVLAVALLVGSRWGLRGLSIAWVVAMPVVIVLSLGHALRVLELAWSNVASAIGPPLAAATAMLLGVHLVRLHVLDGATLPARLAACIVIGVVAYAVASAVFNRNGARQALSFARRFAGGA